MRKGESTEKCTVEGCENPRIAKGLCSTHYDRERRRKRKALLEKEVVVKGKEAGSDGVVVSEIVLDITNYPELYGKIQEKARREIRSVEHQIIADLMHSLK